MTSLVDGEMLGGDSSCCAPSAFKFSKEIKLSALVELSGVSSFELLVMSFANADIEIEMSKVMPILEIAFFMLISFLNGDQQIQMD